MGFQADMAHSVLYLLRTNRAAERIVPAECDWSDHEDLTEELRTLTAALRPWTIDFHVAQADGEVYESGSHDNTGRHCHASDSNDWENRPTIQTNIPRLHHCHIKSIIVNRHTCIVKFVLTPVARIGQSALGDQSGGASPFDRGYRNRRWDLSNISH